MTPRRLFALDQNFPEPVCKALEQWLPADLVPVRQIDPRLSEVDDWQLLLALHQDWRPGELCSAEWAAMDLDNAEWAFCN